MYVKIPNMVSKVRELIHVFHTLRLVMRMQDNLRAMGNPWFGQWHARVVIVIYRLCAYQWKITEKGDHQRKENHFRWPPVVFLLNGSK